MIGGEAEAPAESVPVATSDTRERLLLRRTRQLTLGAAAVLGATVLVEFVRAPQDLLVFAQLLAAIALLVGLAGRHGIRRRRAARRAAHDAGITRMLQGMSRSASSDAMVQSIVDELRRTADADHVVVARLRPADNLVETTLVSTRTNVQPSRSVLPTGVLDPARSRLTRSGRSAGRRRRPEQLIAEDLARRLGETYALPNTLAAPLVSDGSVVGALILSRRQQRDWTAADRRLLAWSAAELSAALNRAFAFEEVEIRANIDGLTGLPNRRYLEEVLSTVGPRRRSGDRLSALMIDLDHFKRLNDRYGHPTGDRVLRAVAERISDAVRAEDTPARYGGEEFCVLLRRADPQQAVDVAERIRALIGAIPPREMGVKNPITVSIGVAVADATSDIDAQSLLGAADRALYRAKSGGRDRVVLAT